MCRLAFLSPGVSQDVKDHVAVHHNSAFIAWHWGWELHDLLTSAGSWEVLERDLILVIQNRARVWARRGSRDLRHSGLECLSSFPGLHLVGICRYALHLPPSRRRPQILKLDLHGQILKQIHTLLETTSMSPIPASFRIRERGVLELVLVSLVPEAGLVAPVPGQRGRRRSQVKRSSWWVGVGAKAASCASPAVWRAARRRGRGGGSMLGGSCHGSASRCRSQSYAGWVRAGGKGKTRGWALGKVHAQKQVCEEETTDGSPGLRAANPKGCAWCYRVDKGEEDYAGRLWWAGVGVMSHTPRTPEFVSMAPLGGSAFSMDQATALELLRASEQGGATSTTASSKFPLLTALQPSHRGLTSTRTAIPAHANTLFINNTF